MKKKLTFKFIKYLIVALIAILTFHILTTTYNNITNPVEPIRYTEKHESEIKESEYIISEEMVMSKLESKSQIVSLKQDLHKKEVKIDDSFFGERQTKLEINGTYKMGVNTKDISVKHIDSDSGIVYIELPKPVLISLELPYDQIGFDKTDGFFRLAMDEEEEKKFYKSAKKNIKTELMKDKELLKRVNLFNQEVVEEILTSMTEIKSVVFE